MQTSISNTLRRNLGATLAAVAFAASAVVSAPAAFADTQKPALLCPGTTCPQTQKCHATKGALGAGCIAKSASTVAVPVVTSAENAMKCRAVKLYNNKGAFSVAGGQRLITCGTASKARGALCSPDKACAHGGKCSMPMTCAV